MSSSAAASSGPEHIDATHVWQMPQGGIDENEDPYKAALRELYEETSIRSVEKLGEIAEWIAYDIPTRIASDAWGGKYRGQKQKWYAFRFIGNDREINIHAARRRRPQAGIHRLALGGDEGIARSGGAVQAARPTSGW